MGRIWSREHLERRIDRCYLLAATTKIADIREKHIARARHYRRLLSSALTMGNGAERRTELA
jgi:hypothetical protein